MPSFIAVRFNPQQLLTKNKGRFSSSLSLEKIGEATVTTTEEAVIVETKPRLPNPRGFYGLGRRKTSSARVWLKNGSGQFTINGKNIVEYFPQQKQRQECLAPFVKTNTAGYFDVESIVLGGGISGQTGAIRLGISRALLVANATLRKPLKVAGYLTRDSRRVERKKPGQKKARKQYQWVKR